MRIVNLVTSLAALTWLTLADRYRGDAFPIVTIWFVLSAFDVAYHLFWIDKE